MLNPNDLVKIFTSSGGEYSSIFMYGIVSTNTEGITTTESFRSLPDQHAL